VTDRGGAARFQGPPTDHQITENVSKKYSANWFNDAGTTDHHSLLDATRVYAHFLCTIGVFAYDFTTTGLDDTSSHSLLSHSNKPTQSPFSRAKHPPWLDEGS